MGERVQVKFRAQGLAHSQHPVSGNCCHHVVGALIMKVQSQVKAAGRGTEQWCGGTVY